MKPWKYYEKGTSRTPMPGFMVIGGTLPLEWRDNTQTVMNMFDIIGPVMVGPSSSHTAGASRAGLVARKLLGEEPAEAEITLFGSFAKTCAGHGVDRAVIGGILGFSLDDLRLRTAFEEAEKAGLSYRVSHSELAMSHPNTVAIRLKGRSGDTIRVTVCSVGGGAIKVTEIDGGQVELTAQYATTVVFNNDRAGAVAAVTACFAQHNINIAFMRVYRNYEGKDAIMVFETDQLVGADIVEQLQRMPNIRKAVSISPFQS